MVLVIMTFAHPFTFFTNDLIYLGSGTLSGTYNVGHTMPIAATQIIFSINYHFEY